MQGTQRIYWAMTDIQIDILATSFDQVNMRIGGLLLYDDDDCRNTKITTKATAALFSLIWLFCNSFSNRKFCRCTTPSHYFINHRDSTLPDHLEVPETAKASKHAKLSLTNTFPNSNLSPKRKSLGRYVEDVWILKCQLLNHWRNMVHGPRQTMHLWSPSLWRSWRELMAHPCTRFRRSRLRLCRKFVRWRNIIWMEGRVTWLSPRMERRKINYPKVLQLITTAWILFCFHYEWFFLCWAE